MDWSGTRLGIEKGKAFAPDERMKAVLVEAAKIATAETRSTYFYPEENMKVYDDRHWFTPLISGHEFMDENGVISVDERATFHFMATGITPDMVTNTVGKGSAYLLATRDESDKLLNGGEHYTVTLPKDVPVANFWSFMVYDNQTRSMLETDQNQQASNGLSEIFARTMMALPLSTLPPNRLKVGKATGFRPCRAKAIMLSSALTDLPKLGLINRGDQVTCNCNNPRKR
ncbi:hypothetical protein-signal peptide prediction [Vibrio astriarenae]|nr:hypothetical protein-signal peptide prediction [Vibrio sp. C7]